MIKKKIDLINLSRKIIFLYYICSGLFKLYHNRFLIYYVSIPEMIREFGFGSMILNILFAFILPLIFIVGGLGSFNKKNWALNLLMGGVLVKISINLIGFVIGFLNSQDSQLLAQVSRNNRVHVYDLSLEYWLFLIDALVIVFLLKTKKCTKVQDSGDTRRNPN